MFPIIPHYYVGKPSSERVIEYGLPSGHVQAPKTPESKTYAKAEKTGAVVSSVIEKNVESGDIAVNEILDRGADSKDPTEQVQVYSHDNTIKCTSDNWSWLSQVHLAEDCQSYNIELSDNPSASTLRIKTVRRISPDEKLVLWFSRSLLILLQIPHLSLGNIQGEKQYICHECQFQCEMPNPLKIHLALDCGKLSKRHLWKRLLPLSQPAKPSDQMRVDFPSSAKLEAISHSAFKPYKKPFSSGEGRDAEKVTRVCPVLPNALLKDQTMPDLSHSSFLYKQAVEMEAIVSNLGRFKQGHLCIYCGKVYSRKYGLKIHIRTHTGFKPLKCKFCLRPFGDPSNLNKHVRLHSEGDTPYKCEQCGKILVRKRDLDRHVKSRH